MSEHAAPVASQRSHWKVKEGVGKPVHVPVAAVSNCPVVAAPVITGSTELSGAAAICAVAADSTVTGPLTFVAISFTRIRLPASAGFTSKYVMVADAESISTQEPPPASHLSN